MTSYQIALEKQKEIAHFAKQVKLFTHAYQQVSNLMRA